MNKYSYIQMMDMMVFLEYIGCFIAVIIARYIFYKVNFLKHD